MERKAEVKLGKGLFWRKQETAAKQASEVIRFGGKEGQMVMIHKCPMIPTELKYILLLREKTTTTTTTDKNKRRRSIPNWLHITLKQQRHHRNMHGGE
jgi:hypothetical protein